MYNSIALIRCLVDLKIQNKVQKHWWSIADWIFPTQIQCECTHGNRTHFDRRGKFNWNKNGQEWQKKNDGCWSVNLTNRKVHEVNQIEWPFSNRYIHYCERPHTQIMFYNWIEMENVQCSLFNNIHNDNGFCKFPSLSDMFDVWSALLVFWLNKPTEPKPTKNSCCQ